MPKYLIYLASIATSIIFLDSGFSLLSNDQLNTSGIFTEIIFIVLSLWFVVTFLVRRYLKIKFGPIIYPLKSEINYLRVSVLVSFYLLLFVFQNPLLIMGCCIILLESLLWFLVDKGITEQGFIDGNYHKWTDSLYHFMGKDGKILFNAKPNMVFSNNTIGLRCDLEHKHDIEKFLCSRGIPCISVRKGKRLRDFNGNESEQMLVKVIPITVILLYGLYWIGLGGDNNSWKENIIILSALTLFIAAACSIIFGFANLQAGYYDNYRNIRTKGIILISFSLISIGLINLLGIFL